MIKLIFLGLFCLYERPTLGELSRSHESGETKTVAA